MGVIKKGGITFAGVSTLQELQDVTIDTLTLSNGQILKYNALNDKWENKDGSIQLSELTDVDFSESPADGNILVYDETNNVWVPGESGTKLPMPTVTDVDKVIKVESDGQGGVRYALGVGGSAATEIPGTLAAPEPTVLTKTLEAGSTSVTFTDEKLTEGSRNSIFTSNGISPLYFDDSTDGELTLYFSATANDVGVEVVVE